MVLVHADDYYIVIVKFFINMSFCQTCQETVQFSEIDGLFYCNQCDCQSETMQAMEHSHFDSQPSQSFSMRSKVIKMSSASKKQTPIDTVFLVDETQEQPKEEDDIVWFAEAFQIILKKQVDALINMGISDKFKEVVELLWFRFLQNSSWAFVSKRLKGKNGKLKKGQQVIEIKEEEGENLNMTWNKSKNMPADGELVKKKKFRLQHLLGILYAALRFLGEPILISDLIRWALDGHLPYYGTSDVLPKHLKNKFGHSGSHLFLIAKPDLLHISKLQEPVSHVLNVVDIAALNHIKLDLVVSRFILSLHLPASFHQITHHLMTKYPYTTNHPQNKKKKKKKKKNIFEFEEGPSLAYIIVAMKLLFGLDGQTEMMSSEIGGIIRNKLPAGNKVALFIWDEWMASEKLRAKHHQINTKIVNPQACREVSDVPRFVSQHSKAFLLDSKREGLNKSHKYQGKSLGSEMQRPFMKVRDQDESSSFPYTINAPSSFPYPSSDLNERLEEEANTELSDATLRQGAPSNPSSDVQWISKRKLASFDFSKSSLDYLLNLTKFCREHGVDPESVLNDERRKARDSAIVSEERERKRKRMESKSVSKGKGMASISQYEDDPDLAVASKGTSNDVRRKKKKTRKDEDDIGLGSPRKALKDGGSDSVAQSDLEELPYDQWKEMVLSRTKAADSSNVSHSVSDTGLRSYSVSYTRYKPLSVRKAKASMEKDGEASVWRPFHQSYQWLLEHCAALFRLDWMYIHEAVATLESKIYELTPKSG